MRKNRICASITGNDIAALQDIEPIVDLFELRIDLVGEGWQNIAEQLRKPWIACNRSAEEGGKWTGNEARRIERLLEAIDLGADMVDVELGSKNLDNIIKMVKKKTRCLISFHDVTKTPSLDEMKKMVDRQLAAGAEVCKVVTTARAVEDNLAVLQLISEFPGIRIVSFAMGPLGVMSRVLCPLLGGDFTYGSIAKGKESAPGQLTVRELAGLYEMVRA